MAELPSASATSQGTGPQTIRVTNHGKMTHWVAFALDFLDKNEDRPIVLHTLPAIPQAPTAGVPNTHEPPGDAVAKNDPPQRTAGSMSVVTSTIPRLISVVEIIKREYIKTLEKKRSPRLSGLHQYNELGCLEDLGLVERCETDEDARANELAMALSGRNHVQQKQTPYMKVTLSNCVLPELVQKGATYQPPTMRILTKSAKARAKKRERSLKTNKTLAEMEVVGGAGPGETLPG